MRTSILAFDPGLTTGYAGACWPLGVYRIVAGQVPPQGVWPTLHRFAPDIIIIESFPGYPKVKVDLTPVEVIGRIKEWAEQANVQVVMQSPAQVKHFFTDKRLAEADMYFVGEQHARDAARHYLYYMKFGEGAKLDV